MTIDTFPKIPTFETVKKLVRHMNYFPRGVWNWNNYGVGGGSVGQCPYSCPGITRHDGPEEDSYFLASWRIKDLSVIRILDDSEKASLNQRAVGSTPTRPTNYSNHF